MNKNEQIKSLPLPPGSFGLPLIGETIDFLRDRDFGDKREKKYGPIYKTHILGRPTVAMVGPEANRFILPTHFDHFSWRDGCPSTGTRKFNLTVANNGGKLPLWIDSKVNPKDLPKKYQNIIVEINKNAVRFALEQGEDLEFAGFSERGKHLRIS